MFNIPALQELAKEFKLMRQDLQAMRASVERIEQSVAVNPEATNPEINATNQVTKN